MHGRYSSMSRPNQQDQEDQGAHVEVTIPATNVNETVRSEVESSSNTSSSSSQSERENESRPSGTSILAHELRKLVDTANDDNKSSSVVNEDITIDENLEPVEELSTTEGAGPGSEASLNDEGGVASESDGPTGSATSTTEVEPHESKDTLLADPEDETSSRSQERSSFTFGARDSNDFPEESQLYEIGLDDEDNTDPFATYDASARSAAMASAAEQPVTSPLRRFMQNRRKGEKGST